VFVFVFVGNDGSGIANLALNAVFDKSSSTLIEDLASHDKRNQYETKLLH
jgi:hypothetical protein